MITEEYVGFDTAKMLKEAGFDVPCTSQYTEGMGVWNVEYPYYFNREDFGYSRPTQALAARWLREVHNISILITPLLDGWMVDLFNLVKYQYILCNKDTMADTYEEALEDGLQEALRLIIKNKDNEQTNN